MVRKILNLLWSNKSVILFIALLLVLQLLTCKKNRQADATLKELHAAQKQLADDSTKIKVLVAKDSTQASQVKALSGITDELAKELYKVDAINDKYKAHIGKLEGVLATRLRDTIYLPQDTVRMAGDTQYLPDSSAHTLTGRFNNHWYAATATVSSDPMKMKGSLSLIVIDSVRYFFDTRKVGTWPFKKSTIWPFTKSESFVTIVHANPFIKEKGISYTKVPKEIGRPKKWAIGIQTGVMAYPLPGTYYFGFGLSRVLIRF